MQKASQGNVFSAALPQFECDTRRSSTSGKGFQNRLLNAWEVNCDGCALARRAVDRDRAAILLHNGEARRKPQPDRLPGRLCGEKRLEQMPLDLFAHTAASIGDGDPNKLAWLPTCTSTGHQPSWLAAPG